MWLIQIKQTKILYKDRRTNRICFNIPEDDLVLLIPSQAESLLHNLEQASRGIGLYVISGKTEFICYNQTIFSLNGLPLELVDQFIYLGNNILSRESVRNIHKRGGKEYEIWSLW